MKKLVLVLVFALFSITAINAEETENKSNNEATTETSINAPVYWQGWAKNISSGVISNNHELYLTVYQSDGICSFSWVDNIEKSHCPNTPSQPHKRRLQTTFVAFRSVKEIVG